MLFGSLFTGIGGFELGLEPLGFECAWQCEIDKFCRALLDRRWPLVEKYRDVRELADAALSGSVEHVELVVGGDPCPIRSKARAGRPSVHPDLAGYFLAAVVGLRPRWVLRENVPAPDVHDFVAALEHIGYRCSVVELDGADFTAQGRKREFVVGCDRPAAARRFRELAQRSCLAVNVPAGVEAPQENAYCISANGRRNRTEDNYVLEDGRGLRVLTPEEAERLQGFPAGYTSGFSASRRWRMIGNAVIPACVRWLGERILEADR